MSAFHLQIVTPEKIVFDGEVERTIVRTEQGDIGILKNKTPYISTISIGSLRVKKPGESYRNAAISEGFVTVGKDSTTILANTCEWADEIDLNRAEKAKKSAENAINSKKDTESQLNAEIKLKKALNRINVYTSK